MSRIQHVFCRVCKQDIPANQPCMGIENPICMGCESAEIDVCRVTLPGEKSGYYEADISIIADMIKDSDYDSGYTVIKEKMLAVRYYNLPEFTGF